MSKHNPIESMVDPCDDPDMLPYRDLLVNILMRSIQDYLDDIPSTHKLHRAEKAQAFRHAQVFFFSEVSDDPNIPWTFAWMVGHLSERPDVMMGMIRNYLTTASPRSLLPPSRRYHFSQRRQ